MARIHLRDVSKVWETGRGTPVEALSNVTFDVASNEFVCILGPSGCGKSTLLQLIGGLESLTGGEILFEDIEAPHHPLSNLVFQEFALFPWKTVVENVGFGLKMRGVAPRQRTEAALHYLRLMGLEGFEDRYPHQLSGGMKQRVSIARVLANGPEVILMDEPFGSLDAQTRMVLQEELLQLWEAKRKTVCFVTHSIEEAVLLGDRIVLMSRRPGRVREVVKIDFPRPRTPEIRRRPDFNELRETLWNSMREAAEEAAAE
ncbi:MAG: ABC transporter ATP-binding protein [Nitrospinota bacterium]